LSPNLSTENLKAQSIGKNP